VPGGLIRPCGPCRLCQQKAEEGRVKGSRLLSILQSRAKVLVETGVQGARCELQRLVVLHLTAADALSRFERRGD
jgi:hypothetical protein